MTMTFTSRMLVYLVCSLSYYNLAHGASSSGTPFADSPLRDFQVQQPPAIPHDAHECSITLVRHLFGNSYGQPATVPYNPPVECGEPASWSAVVANITATSNGTQYDRLAHIYLHGVEVWRTSTPEPTVKGIIWTALKDVTRYTALLAQPGNLTVDLGNLLDPSSGLTGEYDVTLSITFFGSSSTFSKPKPADVILPISTVSGQAASIPDALITSLTLPRNGAQAIVEIYATGDSNEEFWYGNVPDQFFGQLPTWSAPDGYANGKGPFREVQLLIDGILAGVVLPYPVIYTGEFLPTIWRPMVSYGAFDSPTYYIDVSPFLPLLSDGVAHNFTVNVAGMGTDHSINVDWIVSGNIQLYLDSSSKQTTGAITSYLAAPYVDPTVTGTVSGPAPNVSVTTAASRTLSIEGYVKTGSGKTTTVKWEQLLKYSNSEIYTVTTNNISAQLYDYGVHLNHSYSRSLAVPTITANIINTTQICDGYQYQHELGVRVRTGKIIEEYSFKDQDGRTYERNVGTYNVANTTSMGTVSEAWLLYNSEGGSLTGIGSHAS
ncbi:hypothetical protein PUNSTDRAFT_124096 [Punctularia strigosozonata HHB-11173 SS5]|uniref:uncharacterized protein n=1 Tax=Punctularia strigosozonata (strain HHB-11173) TaxID=741275 RepID=UPI000441688D|nr:uncharacterized protein PUNSTDRAFT_124096 [Punctularia strigosozonata HHB-11173 SS5]EIN14642.1 hypothetical protein PUNSTDRAFT_124096 [Punctularia strigosozonata HHB-11173 SS5]